MTSETVGYLTMEKSASRLATTDAKRDHTRMVFIDAIEPKKDLAQIAANVTTPFPNTIDVSYTLTAAFIDAVDAEGSDGEVTTSELQLPVTTIPTQVPTIVAAGYALSPYRRNHDYSETAVRERFLWFEFDAPIQDPNDTYFARVLAYAPDPLLVFPNGDQLQVRQDDPPLAIAPELIRIVIPDDSNDKAGLDAMQAMTAETPDPSTPLVKITPVHYLLPLPPCRSCSASSPTSCASDTRRAFWSTAQGRFGHPTRLSGVQHPAPPLKVLAQRTPGGMSVAAPYATAVFNGRNITSRPPKTEIWCMLYAQVMQADARQQRNVLIAEGQLRLPERQTIDVTGFLRARQDLEPIAFNSAPANLDAPQLCKKIEDMRETGASIAG